MMKLMLTGRTMGNVMVGLLFGALLLTSSASWAGNVALIPQGSVWKYDASGNNLGTAWRQLAYSDAAWPAGPAQLGYGDGDEATRIPTNSIQYTYYFRRTFQITDRSAFSALALRLIKDDGCVVYLNGQEVVRYNMPTGTITNLTPASTAGEFGWEPTLAVQPALLLTGNNIMAVEVHQANLSSSDISFDLELIGTKPNTTLNLDTPADGASGMPTPVTLAATASSIASSQTTVSFYGRLANDVIPEFSIVVLPDTQFYTAEFPGSMTMFHDQIDWILTNRNASNIVYVAHEGDISNNGDNFEFEWFNATNAMYRLDEPLPGFLEGMPYGVAVGNHDQMVPVGDTSPTTYYNQYFGADHFSGKAYYQGHYGANNNNSYQFFSASGMDFIVLTLEYNPSTAVLTWANGLLQQYANRRAILVTHSLLETTAAWTGPGLAIYNALKSNTNLFLMLCGHNHGEARRTDVFNGHTIETVLADYQTYPDGGSGFMRILTFSPSNNEIRFQTYSPYLSQYEVDDSSQFTLSYPMGSANFTLIQQNPAVPSGTQTTATWAGLQGGTTYEWFATANDGLETQSSAVRTFTTSLNVAPTVAITAPALGTTYPEFLSAEVTLTATAADSDGTVSTVEFFADGLSLGTVVTAPYELSAQFNSGTHTITAMATDDEGASSTSAGLDFTVGTPKAPSDLAVTMTSSSADLSWRNNSVIATGQEILESTDGITFTSLGTLDADTTRTTVTGLTPDTAYWFKVRAFNSYGETDSVSLEVTTPSGPPNAPSNFSAAEVLDTQVTLTWIDNSGNETGFKIFKAGSDGVYTFVTDTAASVTSYTVTGLVASTAYYFKVVAVNSLGSTESNIAVVTTAETPHVPLAPGLVSASATSSTEVLVMWQDKSDNEDGFEVLAGGTVLATAPANTSSLTAAGLVAKTTYVITVRSFNVVGCSSSGGGIIVTTPADIVDSYATGETLVLGTLAGSLADTFEADLGYEQLTERLTGGKNTRTSGLEHKWTFNVPPGGSSVFYAKAYRGASPDVDEFVFAYSLDNANFTDMITVTATAPDSDNLSYALPSGVEGTVYIRVSDSNRTPGANTLDTLYVDQLVISTDVSPITTPPPAPTQVVAVAGDGTVTLSWAAVQGTISVYRRTGASSYTCVAFGITGTSYQDSGLVNGTEYEYALSAANEFGEGALSEPIFATPQSIQVPTSPPTNLVAKGSRMKITLTWTQSTSAGVTGNKIYRSSNGTWELLTTIPPATTHIDVTPTPGIPYTYRVTAFGASGESAPSDPVTAAAR